MLSLPRLLLVLFLMGSGAFWWAHRSVHQPPGILAPAPPLQTELNGEAPFLYDGYLITPVAGFEATARVLGSERYRLGPSAGLAPYDLALGWGRMSDTAVLEHVQISQGGRRYAWLARRLPIPKEEISTSSANMHLIPSDGEVRKTISKVRPGQVVHFKGYLVRVWSERFRWNTSTTRTDTGDGACEIVWVQRFEIDSE